MNLVQIQERLKDMPIEAIMAFANGMSPQVPPYLALGELNRRKRMEQAMQPMELPQGTVKEKIEKEVTANELQKQLMELMQMQALRKQQAEPQMQMPDVPEGVPQPPVPEEPGIPGLPVPNENFSFRSGGIITFSDGGLGVSPEFGGGQEIVEPTPVGGQGPKIAKLREQLEQEKIRAKELSRATRAGTEDYSQDYQSSVARIQELEGSINDLLQQERKYIRSGQAYRDAQQRQQPMQALGQPGNVVAQQRPFPQGIAAPPARPAPPPAPQPAQPGAQPTPQSAPQPAAQPAAGIAALPESLQKIYQGQTATPSLEQRRAEAAKTDPYLNVMPGAGLEEYIKKLEAKDIEDQKQFEKMQQSRARQALAQGLIAAGEASRGQKGLGALLAGFGTVAGQEMEAARVREQNQRQMMREREFNRVKMLQEIENARIARAEGRFKDAIGHEQKAKELAQKDAEIAANIFATQRREETARAQIEAQATEARERNKTTLEAARIGAAGREATKDTSEIRLAIEAIKEQLKPLEFARSGPDAERKRDLLARLKALEEELVRRSGMQVTSSTSKDGKTPQTAISVDNVKAK